MEYITIGNVKIEKTASLAPMASVADKAMRTMCKKYGAALLTGEMASAKGLCYSDRKTAALLTVTDYERPMAIQLFGSEPEFMAKAAVIAAQYKPDFIDINCGCPVPKVAGNGAGSALMKDPVLLGHIVEAVVKATDIPVTVKIRKGWDEKNVNAVEVARVAQENGAKAVAVHGRTKNQMYSGKADLEIIAEVKQALSIAVIGNGDVDSGESCKRMYDYTGCDLVMVGRAACGRPWIFCVNAASVLAYMADEVFGVAVKAARNIFGERENKILVELLEKIILQLVSRHFGKLLDYRYVIFNRILLVGIFFSDVAFDEL